MARLDAFIERLASASGSELVFESAHGAVISGPGGPRVLVRQALSTPQIVGAFAEILPTDLQTGFPRPGRTVFPYESPAGPVEVLFEASGDAVRAVVRPAAPGARPEPAPVPPPSPRAAAPTPAEPAAAT